VSALPANDDYVPSPLPRSPVRSTAEVFSLAEHRSEGQETPPLPDSNADGSDQNVLAESGANSGTRIALGNQIPGDWASVTAVYTSSPQSLRDQVDQILAARDDANAQAIAMACWAVLVLIPRGLLHLASWLFAHPLRLITLAALIALLIATQ
jgi:hypothetical protein